MSKLIFEKQSHAILEKDQKRFLLNNLVIGCIRLPRFATTEYAEWHGS